MARAKIEGAVTNDPGAVEAYYPVTVTTAGTKNKLDVYDANTASLAAAIATDYLSGMIESPQNKTYTLIPGVVSNLTVNTLEIYTVSGTCTAALKINGVSITGLSAVAVTSTPQEPVATALNAAAPGDILTLVITSNATSVDLVFRVKYTRS